MNSSTAIAGVSREEALRKVAKRLGGLIVELAHDPEVDVADRIVGKDDEVRRMRIGMEVPEPVDLIERVPDDVAGDAPGIVAARRQARRETPRRVGGSP